MYILIYLYIYIQNNKMARKKNTQLERTSVMIHKTLYNDFKIKCIDDNFNLQKLVNRAIHIYLNDEGFHDNIIKYNKLISSGSL